MKRVIVMILFILLPTVCNAETAKDAIRSLRSLDILTTTGTSYKAYAVCLGEVRPEVNLYLRGDGAKKNKKLRDAVSEIMGLYDYADSLFSMLDKSKGSINLGADASPKEKVLASEYFSRFPEDKKDFAEGGVLREEKGVKLQISIAINHIFQKASKKYAEAVAMLNEKQPPN